MKPMPLDSPEAICLSHEFVFCIFHNHNQEITNFGKVSKTSKVTPVDGSYLYFK